MKTVHLRYLARFILALALIAFVTLSTAHALEKWIFKPTKESRHGLVPRMPGSDFQWVTSSSQA